MLDNRLHRPAVRLLLLAATCATACEVRYTPGHFYIGKKQYVRSSTTSAAPAAPAAVAARPRKVRLAIVLCKFLDKPVETRPRTFYEDFYTRRGTGGVADYWYDATLGMFDLSSSDVFGWLTMNHYSGEVPMLHFPGGRNTLVQWGRDAAAAANIDLSAYAGVIVVQNWGIDHGAAGNGIVIVDQEPLRLEPTFVAHEMGHMFGLPHSFGENVSPCISASGEYCDAWDIMSAMNVFSYTDRFQSTDARWGPGLNAYGLRRLQVLPATAIVRVNGNHVTQTIDLAPLNEPYEEGRNYVIEIPAEASTYTVEYRHKGGWDRGLPYDAVLVHEEKSDRSYLKPTVNGSSLLAGQHFASASNGLWIEVDSIDNVRRHAVVRVSR